MISAKIYLFHIKTQDDKNYYLTSGNHEIEYENNRYLAESGLSLSYGEFNDSAHNHIILHGIFEKPGIDKNDDLAGSTIRIMYLYNDKVNDLVTYICTEHKINDLEFEIRCEPESIKYNRSLLKMFSNKCRASFGDDKCKVNIDDYSVKCKVIDINNNLLTCDIKNLKDEYFTNGTVIANDKKRFKIISHIGNKISIDISSNFDIPIHKQIILIPACDKKFRTCCYSFNNAVNFRGEPEIPNFNIIKMDV